MSFLHFSSSFTRELVAMSRGVRIEAGEDGDFEFWGDLLVILEVDSMMRWF